MQISVKIDPIYFECSTKADILSKITKNHLFVISSTWGNCFINIRKTNEIRVYNIQKHRRKVIQRKDQNNNTMSTIVSRSKWVGYVYDIPIDLIRSANLKVNQKTRNFVLSKTSCSSNL